MWPRSSPFSWFSGSGWWGSLWGLSGWIRRHGGIWASSSWPLFPPWWSGWGPGISWRLLFDVPEVVGVALLVTGGFLWSSRKALARDPKGTPGVRAAVLIGLAQAFAIIPGISRSGATVVAGLWLGVEAEEAAAFSFLMAVPAILGAAVLELPDLVDGAGRLGRRTFDSGQRGCGRGWGPGHLDLRGHVEEEVLSPFRTLLLGGGEPLPPLPPDEGVKRGVRRESPDG